MKRLFGATVAVAAIMGASAVAAQDYSLSPNYGEVRLSSGFSPDPYTVSVTAGGTIDAAKLGYTAIKYPKQYFQGKGQLEANTSRALAAVELKLETARERERMAEEELAALKGEV